VKITKIGYSKTYQIGLANFEKLWLEAEVSETDDVRQCQYALKKQVESFHYESNKAAEKQQEQKKEEPQSQEAKIIAQIYAASDLKVLETFKLLAKNHKAIEAAYNQKLNELLNAS